MVKTTVVLAAMYEEYASCVAFMTVDPKLLIEMIPLLSTLADVPLSTLKLIAPFELEPRYCFKFEPF